MARGAVARFRQTAAMSAARDATTPMARMPQQSSCTVAATRGAGSRDASAYEDGSLGPRP
jgi:hypothetical protein